MISKIRRFSCLCLSAVMSGCLAASSILAMAEDGADGSNLFDTVTYTDVTGKMDLTSVGLENLSSSVLESAGYSLKSVKKTVIVTLDDECLMDSVPDEMGVADYLDTYNGIKAKRNIDKSQENFLNSLSSLGVSYSVVNRYNTVTNAVAIEVQTSEISKIKSIASVKYASVSQTYAYPEEAENDVAGVSNPNGVYETGIYNSSKYVEEGYDGSGMTVAILDTGLDYTHPAFQNIPQTVGMTKQDVAQKLSEKEFNATVLSAESGKQIDVDDLYINDKVPFAYDYADKDTDVYPAYSQHGVHVAGIVAGDAPSYTDKNGNIAKDSLGNTLPFKGVAPNAQLVICKVFTDDFESRDLGGAVTEDLIAALDDCVYLGVDVINMSLGTTAGFSSTEFAGDDEGIALSRVYNSIKKAGISLICAASNDYSSGFGSAFGTNLASNPDSGTVGSPSTYAGALSVASINGQLAPFMLANGTDVIYYTESSDENANKNDFGGDMLNGAKSKTFKYVVVPNVGRPGDYSDAVMKELTPVSEGGNKQEGEKVIAVVKRGTNTFKDKVEIAQRMGADAVIIYNNVAGTVGMSLGDLEDPIPAISVTMDAGDALCYDENGVRRLTGTLELNTSYQAGPFMNEYSSWGTTPDLKLKPEITSHGGEITSVVSGGYDEMSGTSMASPNLAGFVALLRGKLKAEHPEWEATQLNKRINQIVMSTATTVYDQDGLPYSPRKQGAGLATLDNVFNTKASLSTLEAEGGAEDDRPKIELGDDKQKTGVYEDMTFYVTNFGTGTLKFRPKSIFMTETLSSDNLSVAEKAYILDDIPAQWKVGGVKVNEGETFEVAAGQTVKIQVTLTLSDAEKDYINKSFKNGMFVEGFLQLLSDSANDNQCDLTLPFMGFFGDWEAAPMLDYDCFEISSFQQDSSWTDETRPQAQVWATQAYATYYNEKYTVPLGSYCYVQDERADQIYTDEEHVAISRFDDYFGEDEVSNYLTTTSIKALYAGLLRNAEVVTYDLYNVDTGELLLQDCVYRVGKAIAGGGAAVPANVKLGLYPEELGLVNNGKYQLKFHFYFKESEVGQDTNSENEFSMNFYVDYEAPILVGSRIRYYDYKENNVDKQKVYLDLDVFDNHYAQAVMLCYSDYENDSTQLYLATEYITPVYNANKNGVTTVSIEITDFYEKYQNRLWLQIDDYALNHSVYSISFSNSEKAQLPSDFSIVGPTEITIGLNQTYKVSLEYEGGANISNFTWVTSSQFIAPVNNGEIFGASVGKAYVTVTGANNVRKEIIVNVVDSNTVLQLPSISFGEVRNNNNVLVKASGTVNVNAGEKFTLELKPDPWYYPIDTLDIVWSSSDQSVATVDSNGNVTTLEKKGTARIVATIMNNGIESSSSAIVTLSVQEPCTVSGNTLSAYHGWGGENGVLVLPTDKNIMTIGEEAFKDNDNVRVIVIPKTVTQISKRAFLNCTALEEIYFIQEEPLEIPDANLAIILSDAFMGCSSLRKVDLSNVKTISLAPRAFAGCAALEEVVSMSSIGTMYDHAFAGCTSLKTADITGMHNSGYGVFLGCTSLTEVITRYYSSVGEAMFMGCVSLESVEINSPVVSDYAFYGCTELKSVKFGTVENDVAELKEVSIGTAAFYGCGDLAEVDFNIGKLTITSIGDYAFANCERLADVELSPNVELGIKVFENTLVTKDYDDTHMGAVYSGNALLSAPSTITADFEIREGTTEIGAYAFYGCEFAVGVTLVIPDTVTKIGEGAFLNTNIAAVVLPSSLTEIGAHAFERTLIKTISVPAGVTYIGEKAFANSALTAVTFAGSQDLNLGSGAFSGCESLVQITLPNLIKTKVEETSEEYVALADKVFENCTSLEQIGLANVTVIGSAAFKDCTALKSVNLANVTVIGDDAFNGCTALTSVSGLNKVTDVGASAFYQAGLTSIDISSAVNIGNLAFFANNETTVKIPESLSTLGNGAFAGSMKLTSFTGGNAKFFIEEGVVYRLISGDINEGVYEVCAYPSAKLVAYTGNSRVYTIKEGTVSVQAYAFANLAENVINEVVLPYSIKLIGNGAFYKSGILSYVFESINAPVLLTEYYDNSSYTSYKTQYYLNFEERLIVYTLDNGIRSTLKISYPTNGEGYDNYVYTNYFGTVILLGELMDDTTRELKKTIEGLVSADTISGWLNLEVNAENLAMVTAVSETVKAAHAVYNTVTDAKQLEYLGEENVEKLLAIESALKPVKEYFRIPVSISSLELSGDSTHKTEYKVGEKFNMSGLKIIVIYDDYSTELADMSKVTLASGYDGELTALDRYVRVMYEGNMLQIRITVTEDGGTENPAEGTGCNSGCASTTFGDGGTLAFLSLGLIACALAVAVIVRRKKAD